ncbi:MAG TPA: putative LPS assembly protein LptD, partial [Longimicrobiaceae bacterium]|nr:putative LPS assembly protein LptD [Longimicrobiaceae bacterium]
MPPPDSLYQALLLIPGYTPVEYQADSAEFNNASRTLHLRGAPVVIRAGTTLDARDSIVYRERSRFVEAYGSPKVLGQGEDLTGDVMFYDLTTRRATVQGARTKVAQNGLWFVEGDVTSEAAERVYAVRSTFTSDDRPVPAYHFEADKIMIVRDRVLVGRPAVLYFRNVPVMALPFIVQDLGKGRRSGLLIPQFDINDIVRTNPNRNTSGTGREISNVGYYWAMNPYMGLQAALGWRSGSYTTLAGALDYNVRRRFLQGRLQFDNYWQAAQSNVSGRQFNLNASSSWKPSERTDIAVQANYAGSSSFERSRTLDVARSTANLHSNASLGRRFDWGNLNLSAERSQSIADDTKQMTLPSVSLSLNPITLFKADPETGHFFNNATFTFGVNGTRNIRTPGALPSGQPAGLPQVTSSTASATQSLSFGSLSFSSQMSFDRNANDAVAARDTGVAGVEGRPGTLRHVPGTPAFGVAHASWSLSTGYQFRLMGSTTFNPTISLEQRLTSVDDTASHYRLDAPPAEAFGKWISAPPQINFGATLGTDIYGFFPGFGPYSAIRHHIHPGFSYHYVPGYEPTNLQRAAFGGLAAGHVNNRLDFTFDQTFEGKLRSVQPRVARRDSTSADSSAAPAGAETPQDARKVMLLAITTTALAWDFDPVASDPRAVFNPRFQTQDITNTIRSDLLGGLNLSVGHSLFRYARDDSGRVVSRRISPYLTGLSTSFTLGQNSALFRFLGLAPSTGTDNRGGQVSRADSTGPQFQAPQGGATAFEN